MTTLLTGMAIGSVIGAFIGFVAAALISSEKAEALSELRRDEDQDEFETNAVRVARLTN